MVLLLSVALPRTVTYGGAVTRTVSWPTFADENSNETDTGCVATSVVALRA
jgi:hypothetical protein